MGGIFVVGGGVIFGCGLSVGRAYWGCACRGCVGCGFLVAGIAEASW